MTGAFLVRSKNFDIIIFLDVRSASRGVAARSFLFPDEREPLAILHYPLSFYLLFNKP